MPLRCFLFFLVQGLAIWAQSTNVTVDLIDDAPMEQRLRSFPLKNEERQARARLVYWGLRRW